MGTDAAVDIASRISGATTDVATRVTGAIRDAARATGAGFEYLLNTALRESNLNPNAKAKTSSATGLFQFLDQTWLATMKQSGGALGYGKYANAITRTSSGRYVVSDPAMQKEIFALRKDPTANSLMAGAFANQNAKFLTERLGRKPTDGELYMAHFLGASGAARFIRAAETNPNAKAASYFPRAAQANAGIFYNKQGGAKSLRQVYAGLVARHDVIGARFVAAKPGEGAKPTNVAGTSSTPAAGAPIALPPISAPITVAASGPASAKPPVATVTPPVEAVASTGAAERPQSPMFLSLYQGDDRGPVGPVVRELWGARHALSPDSADAVAPAGATSGAAATSPPLELWNVQRAARRPT